MIDCGEVVTKKSRDSKRMVIAGDLYAGGRVGERLADDQKHVWSDLYEEILSHDFRIVNLECPLTENLENILKDGPSLSGPIAAAKGIKRGGFNIVSLANNHIMDRGSKGLQDTLDACNSARLRTVGAGLSIKDSTAPLLLIEGDFQIAVIAIAENEFGNATQIIGGACPLDPIRNGEQIRDAAKRTDFVLVIYHGGTEYFSLPNPQMRDICQFFVNEGADAVVCHHTHVSSGIEWFHEAPIAYGIGNFAFDWPQRTPNGWNQGHLVSLLVGRHRVEELRIIPYEQCVGEPIVRRLGSKKQAKYNAEISALSEAILDANYMASEWRKHCLMKRRQMLSKLLLFNRVERFLIARGIWPFWRGVGQNAVRLAQVLNMIRCESHRSMLLEILQSEIDKQ